MISDDESVEVNITFPRKRKVNKEEWKRAKAKTRRHSGEGKLVFTQNLLINNFLYSNIDG